MYTWKNFTSPSRLAVANAEPSGEKAQSMIGYIIQENVLTHFILETLKGVLTKSADPDYVASDPGLHYSNAFLIKRLSSR